jgi:hypothetical protein
MHKIQEIDQTQFLHHNLARMDAMVLGHFYPHHPPNMALGPLESVNDVFTLRFFSVAGLLVLLFWRIPSV